MTSSHMYIAVYTSRYIEVAERGCMYYVHIYMGECWVYVYVYVYNIV
jgi:hypothetical protein